MMDLVELTFEAELDQPRDRLPPFLGATLRGAFGYLLKRTVCQVSHGLCDQCVLQPACPYPMIFEGLPPQNRKILRKYPRVPQPFVLVVPRPDRGPSQDKTLTWGLRLFGPATRYWPYVVHVFQTIGETGLGQQRVLYHLKTVRDALHGQTVWQPDGTCSSPPQVATLTELATLPDTRIRLRWEFITPLSIVTQGTRRQDHIKPLEIILAGRRRWQILQDFYGGSNGAETSAQRLEDDEFETVESTLTPWAIDRFSGRQQRKVQLRGVLGSMVIEGPWHRAGTWLQFAAQTHLGKATSFGLGQVRWEAE